MTTERTIKSLVSLLIIIVMTLLLTIDDSLARRRDRAYSAPRGTHREKVVVRKHARHKPAWVVRKKLLRRHRKHYRSFRRSHYPARIIHRPRYGYRPYWPGSGSYFFFRGTFYERVPAGYLVVKSPPETVVVRDTQTVVTPVETASGNVAVTVSTLNIRSGPGLDYTLVHQVTAGSILEVHGKSDGWLYVESAEGKNGWVKSVFTEELEPGSG